MVYDKSTRYVLLGRSQGSWSPFVGKSEPGDEDIIETAIREFNEETCRSCILDRKTFDECLMYKYLSKTPTGMDCYLFVLDYWGGLGGVSARFREKRAIETRDAYLEKDTVRWIHSEVVYGMRLRRSFRGDYKAILEGFIHSPP